MLVGRTSDSFGTAAWAQFFCFSMFQSEHNDKIARQCVGHRICGKGSCQISYILGKITSSNQLTIDNKTFLDIWYRRAVHTWLRALDCYSICWTALNLTKFGSWKPKKNKSPPLVLQRQRIIDTYLEQIFILAYAYAASWMTSLLSSQYLIPTVVINKNHI